MNLAIILAVLVSLAFPAQARHLNTSEALQIVDGQMIVWYLENGKLVSHEVLGAVDTVAIGQHLKPTTLLFSPRAIQAARELATNGMKCHQPGPGHNNDVEACRLISLNYADLSVAIQSGGLTQEIRALPAAVATKSSGNDSLPPGTILEGEGMFFILRDATSGKWLARVTIRSFDDFIEMQKWRGLDCAEGRFTVVTIMKPDRSVIGYAAQCSPITRVDLAVAINFHLRRQ